MKDPFAKPDAPRLKPVEVEGWPAPIDLVRGALTLGRARENDVSLPAESFPSVSGRHARVEEREGRLWVVDLGSRNGTLVNGERVTERALAPGDVVRLGPLGPRFMVTGRKALEHTVFVDPKAAGLVPEVSKREVEELVERGARRGSRRMIALGVMLAASLALLVVDLMRVTQQAEDVQIEVLRVQREELASELAQAGEELEQRLTSVWSELSTQSAAANDPSDVAALRRDLDRARAELDDALARFDALDPTSTPETRLSGVAEVRRATVLIESRIVLRHRETGALLHEVEDEFGIRPNFEGEGELFALESTGSGFCVDAKGAIVTNVHVVSIPEDNPVLLATRALPIEPVLELQAVFSGETERHPMTVVSRAPSGLDLALARITPFEGMPYVAALDLTLAPPPPGSDIYLIGFPLGHFALQEGERVIASTFRGILSRNVGGQLQVDAGVHPGNSGGPITDARGRIVGIVCSVQAMPDQTAVYAIGYGIPVAALTELLR